MSLNRLAVTLFKPGVKLERVVASDGVWQTLQPMALNRARPLLIDVEPPGVVVDGVGGASSRMNMAKATVSLMLSVGAAAPTSVMSSGVALNLQTAGNPGDCIP